jgi:predicted  nucleic acid-binding Zn-ribbon protein
MSRPPINVAREIDIWCNKAQSLEKRLSDAARDFKYLSETYPDMRDKSSNLEKSKYNAAKERIDTSYSNVTDTRRYLCGMSAGKRVLRKTRRVRY